MIRNYLTIALRNIFRNKLFSTVNILGLVFGICSAMLIFLWVNDEMAVDGYHENIDRLYRVMENQGYSDGRIYTFAATPGPMAPFIKEKFPEIERASRFTWPVRNLFQVDDLSFYEEGRYVDPDFLSMFTFPLIRGDVNTALGNNNSIVISESMAKKYFGDEEPVGKVFSFNTSKQLTVTGVLKDVPPSSSIKFDYLLPFEIF
ncbi:MAG: ABC transporter permease, partial [Bacteroidia bacterium]|nr:ABC transporter permease [Bacteroidia bacterium]